VLALMAATAILSAACSGATPSPSSGAPTTAPTAGGPSASAAAGEPITIGFAFAKSGFMQPFDDAAAAGAALAIEDINKAGGAGGRQLKSISCDTKTDKAIAAQCATDLIGQGADIIVPSCDFDFGGPAAIVAQQANLITIGCVGSPKFGKQAIGPNAFNISTPSYGEGSHAAEWANLEKGWKTAYMLTDTFIDYTKEVSSAFKTRFSELAGAGGIVGEDTFTNSDTSVAAQVSRIQALATKPDFIWIATCPPGGASATRQIRAAGIDLPIMSNTCMDGEFWLASVPGLKDFFSNDYICTFGSDPRAEVNAFYERFRATVDPAVAEGSAKFGAVGYSIIQAITAAVNKAGSTEADALRTALESFSKEPTLLGPTTYSADLHYDPSRPMAIQEVKDGKQSCVTYWSTQKPVVPAS
jgi:branched-chain amino acid transport system substrate-binding protein